MIRMLFAVVTLLLYQLTLGSCATTNESRPQTGEQPSPVTPTQPGVVPPSSGAPAATTPGENADVKGATKDPASQTSQKQKLFQYTVTLSDPSQPFTDQDREFLAGLAPAPESGSLREAAIVVGTLRACLVDTENVQSFKERDLTTPVAPPPASPAAPGESMKNPPAKKPATAISLEARLADKHVRLTESLQRNMLLRSHRVYYLAQKVAVLTENSEPFTKELNQLIIDEATQWAQLLPKAPPTGPIGVLSPAGQAQAAVPPPSAPGDNAPKLDQNKPITPLVLNPAAQQPGGSLASAQQMADNGQFKQAVDQARKIGTGDPSYPQAKEKIKTFSNQAVQSLRQKAAQAFQNAMPATDIGVKSAYLEQARLYLQQALTDFPDADSLDTVKENLNIITKDIERLESQKSAAKKAKAAGAAKAKSEDETVIED